MLAYHSAVFIDLDGTLVERSGRIPESASAAIRKAQEKGFMIVLTTGRMYRSALKEAERIGINNDSAIISYNGAFAAPISDRSDIIYYDPVNSILFNEIIDALTPFQSKGITIFCYYNDELYVDLENELLQEYVNRTGAVYRKISDFKTLKESPKILALTYFEKPEYLKPVYERIDCLFKGRLEYAFSFPNYLEMTKLGITKGRAIREVISRYGIAAGRTYAIGDSFNDCDMFRSVAVSIAMGNADERVKNIASHVTTDITRDGLHNAFERYIFKN
ncbi:MAG TPA: HAD family hydrolase [Candidatus Wallbacteria bacterium]|nr:HAD family hydrolase [Candidatus Wallbacteria bacterium]